jgi:hypothetical protein
MNLSHNLFVVAALTACTLVQNAHAIIIDGSVTGGSALTDGGTFAKLSPPLANPFGPPNSVGNDTFQSPNLYGFDEDHRPRWHGSGQPLYFL